MDIFIGYKSDDRDRVRRLAAALTDLGYSVFWDQNIPAGSTWRQTIGRALEESRLVIICWSKATLDDSAAKWVLDEADEAARTKKPMVPVRLDDVAPPMGHRQVQALDLSGWTGDKRDPAFAELQFAIAAGLNGMSRQGGAIARRKTSGLATALWSVGLIAAFAGGFTVSQFVPLWPVQQPVVAAVKDDAAQPPSEVAIGSEPAVGVPPYDTRLLVEEVAVVVRESRRTIASPPGGTLMGGRTVGISKLSKTAFTVCIDFVDGSMFEGAVLPRVDASPEAPLTDLDAFYAVTGFGAMWAPDGSLETQGIWEDGRFTNGPKEDYKFFVNHDAPRQAVSCSGQRGGNPRGSAATQQ